MNEKLIDTALRSWRSLNEVIDVMTTPELQRALDCERAKTGQRRRTLISRLANKIYQVERKGALKDLQLELIRPKNRRRS